MPNYTHTAGTPVVDPIGTVIDIDGDRFTIGAQTDAFEWPLSEYDYEVIAIFTAVGIWVGDDPVVTGVIAGSHNVDGGESVGDYIADFRGPWAVAVEAPDASTAEALAIAEQLATLTDDDDAN